MLPPFIIEQIREREEKEEQSREAPMLELPLPGPPVRQERPKRDEDAADRGVVIIELLGDEL